MPLQPAAAHSPRPFSRRKRRQGGIAGSRGGGSAGERACGCLNMTRHRCAGPFVDSRQLVPAVEGQLGKDVAQYIEHPSAPAESGIDLTDMLPDLTARDVCLAIVSGARHAAAKARDIEVAAAQYARLLRPAVTVRELANAAGITERAAATRYPNPLSHIPPGAQKGGLEPKLLPAHAGT